MRPLPSLIKSVYYSPDSIAQRHCHCHRIFWRRKGYIRVPIFHSAVAGLDGFLSQDTVSMSVQLFAHHTFCAQEQRPKAHMVNVAEQLPELEMKRHVNILHGVVSGRR